MMDEQRTSGLVERVGYCLETRAMEPWGSGPWDGEPDRIEWRSPRGMPLLLLRNRMGAWCGYVGVPPGHPWHGVGYHDVLTVEGSDPDVNGGLTFAGPCTGEPPDAICHVPQPDEADDVWWLGFDCGHLYDVAPGMDFGARLAGEWASYKDEAFARREVERLADDAALVAA